MTGMNPAFVRKVQTRRRLEERRRKAQDAQRKREAARAVREIERRKVRREAQARRPSARPSDIRNEYAVITVRGCTPAGMDVIERFAREHDVSPAALIGDDKHRAIAALRHAAIRAVADAHPEMSTVEIGWLFGGRDHTSIGASLKQTRQPGQKR